MKKQELILSALLILIVNLCLAQQMTIGSYNLRFDNKKDSGNLWVDRGPVVANLIRFHDFDVLGTQEGLKNQLDDIISAVPEYAYAGAGRDDGKEKGEHSAIFYKKSRFTVVRSGDFWLSQTPDKPSLGWDATCCNRICSWLELADKKTGRKFFFFNAHFDHQGVKAREESSKLILEKIKSLAGKNPVIFTGDLNGSQESGWYHTIADAGWLKDSYKSVNFPYLNNSSFNAFGQAFNQAKPAKEIIDHIFTTEQFRVSKWGLLTDTYSGKFPSDHFPVLVVVSFRH